MTLRWYSFDIYRSFNTVESCVNVWVVDCVGTSLFSSCSVFLIQINSQVFYLHELRLKQLNLFAIAYINSYVLYLFFFCSPVFPTRTSYTPTASGLHYFPNPSPTPESQMWSTASTNSEDFDRPKGGTLPDFQRLTSSYYPTNGRAAHINYSSQVVSNDFFFHFFHHFVPRIYQNFWVKLNEIHFMCGLNRTIHGVITMIPARLLTMDHQQVIQPEYVDDLIFQPLHHSQQVSWKFIFF